MKRWPEIRAGLILLAIFFALVDGCPLPPADQTPDWEKGFVEPIRDVQHVVLKPVAWIGRTLQVGQRWSLYQSPSTERYRLWVEGEDMQGRWQLLFRASDPEHTDDAAFIDTARMRGSYDPTDRLPGQYAVLARYLTQRVLDRHPELVAARMRLEKVHITSDGVVPSGQFIGQHVRLRNGPP
ncbi:MAG TPA: hypothetical protein VFV99_30570 [Kofleriaceae bacterium]|nr:hypothetical protein [Kofleriaceae bacterium]